MCSNSHKGVLLFSQCRSNGNEDTCIRIETSKKPKKTNKTNPKTKKKLTNLLAMTSEYLI